MGLPQVFLQIRSDCILDRMSVKSLFLPLLAFCSADAAVVCEVFLIPLTKLEMEKKEDLLVVVVPPPPPFPPP